MNQCKQNKVLVKESKGMQVLYVCTGEIINLNIPEQVNDIKFFLVNIAVNVPGRLGRQHEAEGLLLDC